LRVPVHHDNLVAVAELTTELFGHRHGPMPPTGAPQRDSQIGLPFTRILGKHVIEQRS
jgi:hypothetical protein